MVHSSNGNPSIARIPLGSGVFPIIINCRYVYFSVLYPTELLRRRERVDPFHTFRNTSSPVNSSLSILNLRSRIIVTLSKVPFPLSYSVPSVLPLYPFSFVKSTISCTLYGLQSWSPSVQPFRVTLIYRRPDVPVGSANEVLR